MSSETGGLERLIPTLCVDPASQRRAGRGARINPVFALLVEDLASRIVGGLVSVCPELAGRGPQPLESIPDVRWFAADPETLFCSLCAIAYACSATACELRCYGCGAGDALPQVFSTAGPVVMVADACGDCVGRSL